MCFSARTWICLHLMEDKQWQPWQAGGGVRIPEDRKILGSRKIDLLLTVRHGRQKAVPPGMSPGQDSRGAHPTAIHRHALSTGMRPPAQPQDNQHHLQPELLPQPPKGSPCFLLALRYLFSSVIFTAARGILSKHLPVTSLQSLLIIFWPV